MGLAALGAGGRRFESFCPDDENQGVTSDCDPFFLPISKNRTQKGHAFSKHLLSFSYTFS